MTLLDPKTGASWSLGEDGSGPTWSLDENGSGLTWSPDGSRLLFTQDEGDLCHACRVLSSTSVERGSDPIVLVGPTPDLELTGDGGHITWQPAIVADADETRPGDR